MQFKSEHERTEFILKNVKLVHQQAHKYSNKNTAISYNDLYQEGLIGLLDAVDNYNPKLNHQFSTYAYYRIYSNMRRLINSMTGATSQGDGMYRGTLDYAVPFTFDDNEHEGQTIDIDTIFPIIADHSFFNDINYQDLINAISLFKKSLTEQQKMLLDRFFNGPSKQETRSEQVYNTVLQKEIILMLQKYLIENDIAPLKYKYVFEENKRKIEKKKEYFNKARNAYNKENKDKLSIYRARYRKKIKELKQKLKELKELKEEEA